MPELFLFTGAFAPTENENSALCRLPQYEVLKLSCFSNSNKKGLMGRIRAISWRRLGIKQLRCREEKFYTWYKDNALYIREVLSSTDHHTKRLGKGGLKNRSNKQMWLPNMAVYTSNEGSCSYIGWAWICEHLELWKNGKKSHFNFFLLCR